MDGREPFGFADGLSQPSIDWIRDTRSQENDEYHYRDRIAAGEMVLGYTNEYGLVTDRPFVPEQADPHGVLRAFVGDDRRDLGANGSYLVIRQLEQDVTGFWQFLESAGGSRQAAEQLAEKWSGEQDPVRPLPPLKAKPRPSMNHPTTSISMVIRMGSPVPSAHTFVAPIRATPTSPAVRKVGCPACFVSWGFPGRFHEQT